ncbi:MAG TPA: ABC transporter substrate-binding protein [Mobilitalea sp.]|nr:ABC transporter substrate-binding protein [Mobilitalea sp.]
MKKRIIAMCILLLTFFTLTACSNNNTDSSKSKNEKLRIVLDWTPNTNHTGLYVAQAKGYFAEAGLEVEIMQPPEGSSTSLVGAGGAEFGISFQDTIAPSFASDSPMPITAVATIIQHNTSGIISLKETGIASPAKLAGHSYATWDSPIELAIIKKIVEDDGGNYEDVKLIPNTVTDVVTALQTDIESVWVYYAWDGIATEIAGLETNYFNFADYGTELDFYSPVIIANNDYINKNPETTKKFLDAARKGYEYAITNPEDAADILLKAVPEMDETLVKKSQLWLADQYKAETARWGYIDQGRWDAFYIWLFENNLVEQEIPTGTGFTNDYLPE